MPTTHSIPRIRPYICSRCLLNPKPAAQREPRRYTTTTTTSPSPPPPPAKGYTRLSSRRLISISGPDATKYLQGVITQNVFPAVSRTTGFYAAFLNAKGRVLNDVFIYSDPSGAGEGDYGVLGGRRKYGGSGQGWLIEVDAQEVEALAKHVRKYRVSAKFDIRILEEAERGVWSVWNEGKEEGWTKHSFAGSPATSNPTGLGDYELGCLDSRAPGMGHRLLLPADTKPEVESDESTEDAYRIRRYLKGVAEGQDEILKETALPQESNIDFMGGVDYRKGCYVGQELTIRTHHTGVVRKRILPVMVYGVDTKMPDTLEYRAATETVDAALVPKEESFGRVEKKGRSAGKWLAGVGNVGLGLCRLEIMTGGEIMGADEFKVGSLKVKAFVPAWHL